MAATNDLATRAEREEFDHAEAVERRHSETFPEGNLGTRSQSVGALD